MAYTTPKHGALLLTGFDKFSTFKSNPSYDAVVLAQETGLFDRLPLRVKIAQLPVVFETAFEVFAAEVEALNPVAAVAFGVHFGGATRYRDGAFYMEELARNVAHATRPDMSGNVRSLLTVPGGPETIPATLPMSEIARRLRDAGFDANMSADAGDYLCNHIFYTGMHAYGARFPFGFVHVPPTLEHGGTISLERLAQGMAVIAEGAMEFALRSVMHDSSESV